MRRRAIAGVVIAAVLFAACGDDGPDSEGGSEAAVAVSTDVACPPIEGYDDPVSDEGIGVAEGGQSTVDAGDFFFAPTCIVDDGSGTVTLTVENSGNALHNVSVADQNIDIDVLIGETIEVEIEVGDEPLVFICKYHRTAGMVGAVLPSG